jgi:glycosyltransferase involved in cell wall biosynthesis
MVLNNQFPPDRRIAKEAKSLIKAGHEITLISWMNGQGIERERIEGIDVIRVPQDPITKVTNFFCLNLFFVSPQLRGALNRVVREEGVEIIHAHDLETVRTSVPVAKRNGLPLIADLHENMPEAVSSWICPDMALTKRLPYLLSTVPRWKRYELEVLKHPDKIIAITEEGKQHYVNDCGKKNSDVTVVMNTVDLDNFNSCDLNEALIRGDDDFIISYIGGFGEHRGIKTAIRAISLIVDEIPNLRLYLVGRGDPSYDQKLKEMCESLGVMENVTFTGWAPFSDVPSYIDMSDICLVPHLSNGHTNTTVPHKLFQYMAMKKPVVVSDAKPLKRLVESSRSGLIFHSDNQDDLASKILDLYHDRDLAERLGNNGRKAVENKYNWEIESERLLSLYEHFERS